MNVFNTTPDLSEMHLSYILNPTNVSPSKLEKGGLPEDEEWMKKMKELLRQIVVTEELKDEVLTVLKEQLPAISNKIDLHEFYRIWNSCTSYDDISHQLQVLLGLKVSLCVLRKFREVFVAGLRRTRRYPGREADLIVDLFPNFSEKNLRLSVRLRANKIDQLAEDLSNVICNDVHKFSYLNSYELLIAWRSCKTVEQISNKLRCCQTIVKTTCSQWIKDLCALGYNKGIGFQIFKKHRTRTISALAQSSKSFRCLSKAAHPQGSGIRSCGSLLSVRIPVARRLREIPPFSNTACVLSSSIGLLR